MQQCAIKRNYETRMNYYQTSLNYIAISYLNGIKCLIIRYINISNTRCSFDNIVNFDVILISLLIMIMVLLFTVYLYPLPILIPFVHDVKCYDLHSLGRSNLGQHLILYFCHTSLIQSSCHILSLYSSSQQISLIRAIFVL